MRLHPRSNGLVRALALLAILASPLAAQQGGLTGKVTDEGNGQALPGARIQVGGTGLYAISNAQGTYTIRGLSAGRHQVRVVLIGYASVQREVTVTPGDPVTLDWALRAVPFTLEEIVTTATGDQLAREVGNTVARIEARQLVETAPVSTLTQVLSGRIAGVNVLASNGTTGTGSRIRIRGLSSVSLSNEPQIYMDGVRIVNEQTAPGFIGGGTVSFLNDLNPEDIESIEVVKGPAASTLYGTQAANGVIKIQTKRGRAGAAQWNVWLEGGILKDTQTYPSTYFSARQGSTTAACFPYQQALGVCTISQLHKLSLLEDPATTPFAQGNREQAGVSVSGGTEAVRYFVSGEYERELGGLKINDSEVDRLLTERGVTEIPFEQRRPNELNKFSGRANVAASIGNKLDLSVSVGGVRTRVRLPQTGDNFESIIGTPLIGSANPTLFPTTGGYGFARPAEAAGEETYRTTNHLTNAATANWRPLSWLTARSTVGVDYAQFDDEQNIRNGQGCIACTTTGGTSERLGSRTVTRRNITRFSADVNATASFRLTSRIGSKTSAGLQYNFDHNFFTQSQGAVLPPGILSVSAGANRFTSEGTVETKTLGQYVEQVVSLDDRIFLTGAVRFDANSAFGQESRSATYPKVGASWVAREGQRGFLNDVRLRAALGTSGIQPSATAALTFENPVTASILGASTPAVVLGQLGDPTLKPERSQEIEAGIDFGLLDNKVRLEVTVFNKTTKDALVSRILPPSLGATTSRFENIGEINNKGIEISFNIRPLESPGLTWDLNIEAAGFKNRLVSLGGLPPINGFGFSQREGYPLFGHWWVPLKSFSDKNNDGFIDPTEVVVSDTTEFQGSSVPTRQIYVTNQFAFFKDRLRLSFLGEYKGGFVGLEINTGFQCLFQQNCQALNDPTTSLERQAEAVAGGSAFGAYTEDASFFRLRELSLTYNASPKLARMIGSRSFNVTATARNVFMITGWPSWDPENNTSSNDGPNYNFLQQRQPLVMVLRFNLGY